MSYTVTQDDILSVTTDAAVICIENTMAVSEDPVSQTLSETGGEDLLRTLKRRRFLPVGSACAVEPCGLPFKRLFAVGAPQWRNGESNELLVLRRCYESLYRLARETDCRSLAVPFLSTSLEEAVQIAREEAMRVKTDTVFLTPEHAVYELSQRPCRKPQIVSYVGYYRDYAVFRLDSGNFAHVDVRPELRSVSIRPYVEPCYYVEADPSMQPLTSAEIARLRAIYEE